MKQLGIQALLILGTLAISWRLLAGSGQRTQALRRIGLLVLAVNASVYGRLWQRLKRRGGCRGRRGAGRARR